MWIIRVTYVVIIMKKQLDSELELERVAIVSKVVLSMILE